MDSFKLNYMKSNQVIQLYLFHKRSTNRYLKEVYQCQISLLVIYRDLMAPMLLSDTLFIADILTGRGYWKIITALRIRDLRRFVITFAWLI